MIQAKSYQIIILAMAGMAGLSGCTWMERVVTLEERADLTNEKIAALEKNNDQMRGEIDEFRRFVSGRSRLSVVVISNEWRTIYGNSTGVSQIVILTHPEDVESGKLEVRIAPVPRRRTPSAANSASTPTASSIGSEESEAWDLSPIGAQRRQRLGCGFELQARTTGAKSKIDILVQADSNPLTCDKG